MSNGSVKQPSPWDSSIFIIALVVAVGLFTFGILSFFMAAKSLAVVDQVARVFGDILLAALGAKAGLSVPTGVGTPGATGATGLTGPKGDQGENNPN